MKMIRRVLGVGALVLIGGALLASNMGFKYNYTLLAGTDPGSNSGTNTIALPFFRADGINTAADLQNSVGFNEVSNIQRFEESTDALEAYTGRKGGGPDFPLVAGEAYFIKMSANVQYVIVGSHDPALAVDLDSGSEPDSNGGSNFYAYPYHSTADTAQALMDDIGFANVANVQRFVRSTDALESYTGRKGGGPDFNLVPGEGYFIKMLTTVSYVPSHY